MNRILPLIFILVFAAGTSLAQKTESASDFLGYELGSQFTFHHRVIDYVEHVAATSPKAVLENYGSTYEGRDLVALIISSPDNLKNLEQIRKNNLIKTGLSEGTIVGDQKTVIWLNFNIHGDEASATEAGIATIDELISGSNPDADKWLEEVVLIIDPCVNPDGREHFVSWYKRSRNKVPNPDENSQEHNHPWASGRQNHYLVDLNRDWAWQTQIENKSRLTLYKKWMPHVHCDFHEMGHNEDYFFAPAAKPIHEDVSKWQRDFQQYVGQSHSKYFDKEGWLYYTGADFDLFYPSYGDTWPIFNGALGFTYEQGGSRRAGIVVERDNGNELTLKQRMDHHKTTSISTIEVCYTHREKILREFNYYFNEAQNSPKGKYKSFVIKTDGNPDAVAALKELLISQQITFANPLKGGSKKGFDYRKNKEGSFTLSSSDIVVNTSQPMGVLAKVLFEPKTVLEDSMSYDATAWALPYVYNLECYAVKENIPAPKLSADIKRPLKFSDVPYAWIGDWNDPKDMKMLGSLLQDEVKVRYSTSPMAIGGKTHARGSLIILKEDNAKMDDEELLEAVNKAIRISDQHIIAVESGMTPNGQDLGHYSNTSINGPKIALMGGKGVSTTEFGSYWWFFDQEINYPVSIIHTDYMGMVDLSEYDVIICPSGMYGKSSTALLDYAKSGGKLILVGSAIGSFTSVDEEGNGTALGKAISALPKKEKTEEEKKNPPMFAGASRRGMSEMSAGSIYRIKLDASHPLGYGAGEFYFTLKTNSSAYPYIPEGSGWNIGRILEDNHISGFAGYKLKEKLKNTMELGVEDYGSGTIIYFADNPIFRDFWHGGKIILGNAVFFVGQ